MTAPSKSFTTIADTAVDPDSPIDTALITALRDNGIHNYEWIGAGYTPSQAHTHDGVDSALLQIGSNYLRNGSFEDGTSGWTITPYSGGSSAISTSSQYDGEQSLELTSTVLANGGAQAISNEYLAVSGGEARALSFSFMASTSGVSSKVEAIWYDKDQGQISATTILSTSSTPTSWRRERLGCVAPSAARFMRIQITGGVPALGSSAGTVRIDGVSLTAAGAGLLKVLDSDIPASSASLDLIMTDYSDYANKLILLNRIRSANDSVSLLMRFSTNGGASFDSAASNYDYAYMTVDSASGVVQSGQSDTSALIFPGSGNQSQEEADVVIELLGMNNPSARTKYLARTQYVDAVPRSRICMGGGNRAAAQDTDAVRLFYTTGNIAGGRYMLFLMM